MRRPGKTSLTLRETLKAGLGLMVVTVCGGWRRARREPDCLEQTETILPIRRLPDGWTGTRLVLLADIHARRREGPGRLERIVEAARAAAGDLIVIAGDVGARGAFPDYLGPALSRLSAPLGVWATLGNHDYPDIRGIISIYESAGIEALVNEHRILRRDGDRLCLAGLDDWRKGEPDAAAALAGAPEDLPRLIVSHNPDYADHNPPGLRIDAMLCGHTHGGQVRLWGWGATALPVANRAYGGGLAQGPGFPLYVSRGLGTCGMRVRFHCPPEIAVLTLTPDDPARG